MTETQIQDFISSHVARNSDLYRLFMDKKADLTEARLIECHFWTWSKTDAEALARELERRGFDILRSNSAASSEDPHLWNLEAIVKQSISLTVRREFTEELVRLADLHGGRYDGWGTSI